VAENRGASKSLPGICPHCNGWLDGKPPLGFTFAARKLCWQPVVASRCKTSPLAWSAIAIRFAAPAGSTNSTAWPGCSVRSNGVVVLGRFPPLQRAQIVELASLEPIAEGLHITHWSSEDLAREAVRQKIVPQISARTVRRILNDVDLQPHRTRYWKTTKIDPLFKKRAEQVLWCYAHAPRLAEQGRWVVCVDELPNFQILERPVRRGKPGSIERQEFEYTRHGVATMLLFLIVHTGEMRLAVMQRKTAAEFVKHLQHFREDHSDLDRVFLIHDGDPSHTAKATQRYLHEDGWWRPRRTPVHASWLDQAEILINMFSSRYLVRQSWSSRSEFLDHVEAACPEYNEYYARPIQWTWTSNKMREWYEKHHS